MFDPDWLTFLVCPETHQPLTLASAALVADLNARIRLGSVRNRAGQVVTDDLDAGLVREDGRYLYPLRGNLPILLIDEAIPVLVRR